MAAKAKRGSRRYTIDVDRKSGLLRCIDTQTGEPVDLGRCTTISVDRERDAISVVIDRSRCRINRRAEKEFLARLRAGKNTHYTLTPDLPPAESDE